MLIFIRSLVFQFYFYASVAVATSAIALLAPFPFGLRFAISRGWAQGMLWVGRGLCGLDYVIEGRENIPDKPCVFMIKHTTVFEAYAQIVVLPRQSWVVKRELLWIPIFGWGLAAMRPIAIDRGSGHSAVRQVIERGKALLAQGVCLSIFPEGTRMGPGETRRYGVSGAALAAQASVDIVPIAHNAGDFWPRRGLRKRPGLIRFCIGPPISASKASPKETNLRVQSWIENKMAEISCHYAGADDRSTTTG